MAKRGRRPKQVPNTLLRRKRTSKLRTLNKEEKESKAKYEQLRRRRWCLAKKTKELSTLCQMKVFLQVTDQAEQRTDYFSSEVISDTWPFPPSRLASICEESFLKSDSNLNTMLHSSKIQMFARSHSRTGQEGHNH
jgi:hypothetical protein